MTRPKIVRVSLEIGAALAVLICAALARSEELGGSQWVAQVIVTKQDRVVDAVTISAPLESQAACVQFIEDHSNGFAAAFNDPALWPAGTVPRAACGLKQ